MWCVIIAVVASSLRSVCVLIEVLRLQNFSSNLSSNSFMVLVRYFLVMSGLALVALPIAWIFSVIASFTGA